MVICYFRFWPVKQDHIVIYMVWLSEAIIKTMYQMTGIHPIFILYTHMNYHKRKDTIFLFCGLLCFIYQNSQILAFRNWYNVSVLQKNWIVKYQIQKELHCATSTGLTFQTYTGYLCVFIPSHISSQKTGKENETRSTQTPASSHCKPQVIENISTLPFSQEIGFLEKKK